MDVHEGYLRPDGAAKFCGLALQTLDVMRIRGTGPQFCKVGKAVVYKRGDLTTWLDSKKVQTVSQTTPSNEVQDPARRRPGRPRKTIVIENVGG